MLIAVFASAAWAAPALAHSRDRDEIKKDGISLSLDAGPVKVAANVEVSGAHEPEASVTVSAPAVSASVAVDSAAPGVSVDATTPVVSASLATDGGSQAEIVGSVDPTPVVPVQRTPVLPVRASRHAEPTSNARARVGGEASPPTPDPAVAAPAPAPVVAAPKLEGRSTLEPKRVVRHVTPLGNSRPVKQSGKAARLPAVDRTASSLPVSMTSVQHVPPPLGKPTRTVSSPAAGKAEFRPAKWLGVVSDNFGRSGAGLGAGSAAVLLFALVTAFALAAPRRGLWPRPHHGVVPQPALPSALERPG